MSSNDLTTLPADVFDGLSALESLDLSGNPLTTLPADIFDGLSVLGSLSLGSNDLTTLPADVFDGLSALESLDLDDNNFTALTGLPEGVFDDVLDTLGAIGEDSSASFRVDDNVRSAHFVCSRADADAIVAATAGVDDCLRITSAQLPLDVVQITLDADIAGDDVVNIVEQRDGFTIGGTVAAAAAVSVTVGGGSARDATVSDTTWSLAIAANDADITGAEVEIVVTATLSGNQDGEARRTLTVDLTAPAATWTAPATLTVGTAITDIPAAGPSADIPDANGYAATDLPAGLMIDADTGAISGAPTTANANPTTATITLTDTNGNAGAVDLTFPAVDRSSQTLTGFAYSATTAMVGDTAPTVTAPTGAVAGSTLSYSTSDTTICTVDAGTGVLTLVGAGTCTITVTASATANHNAATADFEIQVGAAGMVMVTLDADIAGDDVVNIVERRDGFTIGGTVAATAAVSVTVGGGSARDATVSDTTWSLAIAANDADITGAEVEIVVTATLIGMNNGEARRTLTVDLTAPAATWTAPATLTVGVAITDIPAAGPSADIPDANGYAATDLPAGLMIDANTGAISGAPTTANANPAMATITLTDTNGNAGAIDLTFPAVGRGTQILTGFAYSATTAMVGDTAPTVTAPTGAVAGSTLSYSTSDATICTVDAGTGVLTAVGAGTCTITVTASATANHNAATADFEIQVGAADTVMVTLDADIAGDDVVNIVERRDGFTIGGTVAATAAVSVTVGGGSARDATVSDTTWSLAIAANDADITGAEVEIVVTATLSGNQDGEARRTLTVDLTAPAATWTAPATLTVGVAITDIPAAGPSADIPDANGYAATDLPAGLMIDANTGAISGAPTTANANVATATITLTDTNGNTGTVDLTFPAVDRGSQTLTGFAYSATTAMVGQTAPTVTAPTGAVAGSTLSYSTSDATICTVDAGTGVLTLVDAGTCTITVTASATDNHNAATADFEIQVGAAGMVMVTLDADIAGDDVVNIVEQRDGFTIGGTVAAAAAVSVTVGGGSARDATVSDTTWSLAIAANDADITGAEVEIVVTATLSGNQDGEARRTLTVDLTAPAATWTLPATLTVGVAITDIPAAGPSADIPGANGYAATDLPAGLMIDANTGAISGAPTTANANPATATITLTDTNGNTGTIDLTFPAVDRGTQILTGFAYSATTATVDQTAPTVTAPTGAVAGSTLSYSTSDATICTVDAGTGVLTLVGAGTCTITVTASATANHNAATADFEIQVGAAGMVMVTLDADIAGDDVVNIVERRDGFTIGGAADAGATVTVTVGGMAITSTATAAADDTWTITVPGNFAGITGASAEVVATASMGALNNGEARRALTVDLTAPTATWTAPATLTVGVAIADIPAAGPSADIPDANGYAATDLPAGLMINANTGAISGAPTTANPDPATATITLTDTNGNAGAVDLTFPAVGRGTQILTGFAYSATTATVDQTAPTVTAPTGAVAGSTLSYSTSDATICTVDAGTGVLTAVGAGTCTITVTASATANHNAATADFEIQVGAADTVMVTLNDNIAGDDVVNIVEQRDGFTIGGAADAGATVTVTVGGMAITSTATATADNTWTLAVAGGFSGIAEPEVEVVATASMVTLTNGVVRRRLTVDLTAPTAIWTAPATLTAGEAITDIIPVNPSADIPGAGGYAASDLPAGLTIDADTGVINGAPTTAETNPATATITLTDTAGNEGAVALTFPAVGVGGVTITTTGNGDREISGDDNGIQVEVANDVPENVSLVIPDLSVVERPSTIEIRVGDLPPAPAGITFGAATTSVDINVSLTASAQNAQNALATVCLPRPADLTEPLAVYHYRQGRWEALPGVMAPSDLSDVVCGETNTFSPFQVGGLAAPRVTLVLDQTSIDEDGGVATLTARLNRALSVDTTLTVTVDPVGDTRARDFMLSGNVLTIVSGASTGSVTISAVDNGVGNPNRQVRISVTATTGDVSVTGPGSVTLTIIDDESPAQERREQGIAHALGGIARTLGWELTETIRERSRGADGVGSRVKVAKLPQSSTQGDDATMTDLLTSGTEIEMTSAPIDRATAPMVRAWARGDKADFNNTPFDGRTQDGEIVSVRAGMDAAYDSGWVLGGAVGWHDIDVTFDDSVAATSGTIGGEIWSLNPYISLTRDRLHLWGAIGGGAGTLHYEDTHGATSSNLRMLNGAVGAEHGFGNIGAFDLIGRGEGMFVEIDLDGSPDAGVGYDDQEVTVYGIRGEFELGLPLRRGGVDIRPYGLVGVRWDGGDMDTGAAAEYGVGIDLRSKDFYVEASARSQFSEEDDEALNLTSYSLSFGYDRGNDQRGLMVEFGQSAGSSEYNPYGGGALPSFGVSAAGTDAEATIKLNARYGTEFGHGMLIPYVETDWQGSQLSTFGSGLKYEFKGADIGLHYDYAPTSEEDRHRINLRAQFRF